MLLPPATCGAMTTPDLARMSSRTLGSGPVKLVVIPGAGDGQATVEEAAGRLRLYFARRARRYRNLYISRRQPISSGFSVEQHADDYIRSRLKILNFCASVVQASEPCSMCYPAPC